MLVATAVGAAAGASVVFSLVDLRATETSEIPVAARTLARSISVATNKVLKKFHVLSLWPKDESFVASAWTDVCSRSLHRPFPASSRQYPLPDFAAVHESDNGPSRHFVALRNLVAIGA